MAAAETCRSRGRREAGPVLFRNESFQVKPRLTLDMPTPCFTPKPRSSHQIPAPAIPASPVPLDHAPSAVFEELDVGRVVVSCRKVSSPRPDESDAIEMPNKRGVKLDAKATVCARQWHEEASDRRLPSCQARTQWCKKPLGGRSGFALATGTAIRSWRVARARY